jgi:tRNA threonylcarbamoyladenosine biosynthesis protein TsaB
MNILAIETARDCCRVGLLCDGQLVTKAETEVNQHSRRLLVMADALFHDSGIRPELLDRIVWSAGPGSFTGLRIASSFCQALVWVHSVPVIPVSTLAASAQAAWRAGCVPSSHQVAVALDARMGDVYLGLYKLEADLMVPMLPDQLIKASAEDVLAQLEKVSGEWILLGDGWPLIQLADCSGVYVPEVPAQLCQALIELGKAEPLTITAVSGIEPRYLRGVEHWKKKSLLV